MKKKKYIAPQIEEIHLNVSYHFLAGSDGGHFGGNPRGQLPDDDDDENGAKFNRVGYSFDVWSTSNDKKTSSRKGLWD